MKPAPTDSITIRLIGGTRHGHEYSHADASRTSCTNAEPCPNPPPPPSTTTSKPAYRPCTTPMTKPDRRRHTHHRPGHTPDL